MSEPQHGMACPKRPQGKPPSADALRRDPANRERRVVASLREWLRAE